MGWGSTHLVFSDFLGHVAVFGVSEIDSGLCDSGHVGISQETKTSESEIPGRSCQDDPSG